MTHRYWPLGLLLSMLGCAPLPPVVLPGPPSAQMTPTPVAIPPASLRPWPSYKAVTIAGKQEGGYAGDGGPATAATFQSPVALTFDGQGNLFVVDAGNRRLRQITPNGVVNTVFGNGLATSEPLVPDRPATATPWATPSAVAVDSEGNLYVPDGDYQSVARRILKITPTGRVSAHLGQATLTHWQRDERPGPAFGAWVEATGLASDAEDNLFISDRFYQQVVKVTPDGWTGAIAGHRPSDMTLRNYGDDIGDDGPATKATLRDPRDLAIDLAGNVYVIDKENARVRRIGADGRISTYAGDGVNGFSGDGRLAFATHLNQPEGLAIDSEDNLYIADTANRRLRVVGPSGVISTIAQDAAAIRDVAIDPQGRPHYITGNQIKRLEMVAETTMTIQTATKCFGNARR